jgi:hypothetical protein
MDSRPKSKDTQVKYAVEMCVILNSTLIIITLLLGKLLVRVDLPGSLLHQHGQPQVATVLVPSGHLQILWAAAQLGNQKQAVMMNWSNFWIVQNIQSAGS